MAEDPYRRALRLAQHSRPCGRALLDWTAEAAVATWMSGIPIVEMWWKFCELHALTGDVLRGMFVGFRGRSDAH